MSKQTTFPAFHIILSMRARCGEDAERKCVVEMYDGEEWNAVAKH